MVVSLAFLLSLFVSINAVIALAEDGDANQCVVSMKTAIDRGDDAGLLGLLQGDCKDDINETLPGGTTGQTLLRNAVTRGKSGKIIKLLLDHGADVTIGQSEGKSSLLHGAAFQGRAEAIKILVEHPNAKININERNWEDDSTPLHRACIGKGKRHTEAVRMLLQLGANPNQPSCRKIMTGGNKEEQLCRYPIDMAKKNPMTLELLQKYTTTDETKHDEL